MADDRFYVKSLTLENFRCFEKTELGPFDPHFNLIVGGNGAGKSSVLLALANLFRRLANLPAGIAMRPMLSEIDVRVSPRGRSLQNLTSLASRLGEIRASFEWQSKALAISESLGRQVDLSHVREPKLNIESQSTDPLSLILPDSDVSYPILLRFTTNRHFQWRFGVNNTDMNKDANDRWEAFHGWINAGATADELRSWMRDETIIHLQKDNVVSSAETAVSSERNISPLDLIQNACRESVEDAESIYYDGSRKDIVVSLSDGRELVFSGMSDGQRALVGMVAEIARRVTTLNWSYLGPLSLIQTAGMVLIDEIDLHLHPRWQRRIIRDLKRIFPKIQFFATSHSPQVIGEAKPHEIVLLGADGQQKRPIQSYGMDSNWVLECVMEAEGRDPAVAAEIRTLFNEIEEGEFDRARARIATLRETVGGFGEVEKAEAYMWNVEHGGEEAAE